MKIAESKGIEPRKFLTQSYPNMFIEMNKRLGRYGDRVNYKKWCQSQLEISRYTNYSLYVHGFLLPHFDELRKKRAIKKGK